jgi:hypothetical protein
MMGSGPWALLCPHIAMPAYQPELCGTLDSPAKDAVGREAVSCCGRCLKAGFAGVCVSVCWHSGAYECLCASVHVCVCVCVCVYK